MVRHTQGKGSKERNSSIEWQPNSVMGYGKFKRVGSV